MRETDIQNLQRQIDELRDGQRFLNRLENNAGWIYLTTPLTSTSWDGDSYSTTAKTKIDLSAVFGAPAGIKAIYVRIFAGDSGSLNNTCYLLLSPNDTEGSSAVASWPQGKANNAADDSYGICPCDENGDVYYQIRATGANTLFAYIQIWGYLL